MNAGLHLRIECDGVEREIALDADSVTLGRSVDCEVRIEDPMASRSHCRVERLGSEVFVVDLDSANGTWLSGRSVDRFPILPGENFQVGGTTITLLETIRDRLSVAETTQTQQRSREGDSLHLVFDVLQRAVNGQSPERVAHLIIDAAIPLAKAERGFMFLENPDGERLVIGRNFARETIPGPETKLSKTLLEQALRADGPLLLRDAASDGEFTGVASVTDLGLRSLLAVPIRHHDEVLGLLVVDHRMASGAFSQSEVTQVRGLAAIAALSLGSLRQQTTLQSAEREVARLKNQLGRRLGAEEAERERLAAHQAMDASGMVGASAVMRDLFADVARLAPTDVTILIEGESGTGKELVASALQRFGARSAQPFVVENCGALPDTLLESELFGHVKGAFTGATSDKAGRFEQADGGTLFLDEIGEMSEAMQQRLLRVLQEGEVRRLGSSELIQVDVRVLAATNRDLHAEVQAGRFREDLFYRLKVVSLELPALREREGDIELLAEHFLALEAADFGCPQRTLSGPALTALQRAHWPGNVRQLRHEIRRLTVLAEGEITFQELSTEITDQLAMVSEVSHDGSLPSQVDRLERTAIENALSLHEGNRNAAADTLGITRYALKRKMKKLGLVEDLNEE